MSSVAWVFMGTAITSFIASHSTLSLLSVFTGVKMIRLSVSIVSSSWIQNDHDHPSSEHGHEQNMDY